MNLSRRSFLGALTALVPVGLLGWFRPKPPTECWASMTMEAVRMPGNATVKILTEDDEKVRLLVDTAMEWSKTNPDLSQHIDMEAVHEELWGRSPMLEHDLPRMKALNRHYRSVLEKAYEG